MSILAESQAEEKSSMGSLLAKMLAEETFRPAEPRTIAETGLSATFVEDLLLKFLLLVGSSSGRDLSERMGLPMAVVEPLYSSLRQRQMLVLSGNAQLNDYVYALTDQGRSRAKAAMSACAYVGPAPAPLSDYITSVEAQTVRAEAPKRRNLEEAFKDVSVEPDMFEALGPAINSGAGLFMYGAPGNGKTTLARRITACFGQEIWIPYTIVEDGQIVKVFDAAYHEPIVEQSTGIIKAADYDRRWIKVKRPTVIVGGELTMEGLEIRHDHHSNIGEAPLQLKSNCGCLLIDDFGRQRIQPAELLNRWIIPLENRYDFLTLATGKKIQVPFEQLIIFSTNLDPKSLADEAFLRRIPYKVHVGDPSVDEFHRLFQSAAKSFRCEYSKSAVDYLIERHYRPTSKAFRRCHARDLMSQISNYCKYNEFAIAMRPDYFDRAVANYFTVTGL